MWTWGEIAGIGSLAMTIALAAERIVGRLMRGQYVTRGELQAVERSAADGLLLEGRLRSNLDAKVMVIEANMMHLPTADDVADLKERLSDLRERQAASTVQLDHMREEVRQTRLSIDRLSEELRKRD